MDESIPADHCCRVIDDFVARLDLRKLDFAKAAPAATGRPPYDLWTCSNSVFMATCNRCAPHAG
jgi:hypothetical protein